MIEIRYAPRIGYIVEAKYVD